MRAFPPPVYRHELPLDELRTAELFLVVALRLFVAECRTTGRPIASWREGFRAAGIAGFGAPAFDALLGIVALAARRSLDVRCPSCQRLGFDEGRLLQIVSALQQSHVETAQQLLADWLRPAAARMALLPARGLADAMASADLFVPLRHREAALMAANPAQAGLALVH